MRGADLFVSVVVPLSDDPGSHGPIASLQALLEREYENYEIVLVDDCGPRESVAALEALMARLEGVRLVSLSRPMGSEVAIQAGLESAIGDLVVTLQIDRDPIEEIPRLGSKAQEGFDVVVGIVRDDEESAFSRWLSRRFYAIADRLLPTRILR